MVSLPHKIYDTKIIFKNELMKKLFLTLLVASTLVFTGCFKDDDTPIVVEEITIINGFWPGGKSQKLLV